MYNYFIALDLKQNSIRLYRSESVTQSTLVLHKKAFVRRSHLNISLAQNKLVKSNLPILSRSLLNYSCILVQIVGVSKNGSLPLGMQDGCSVTQYCEALKWDALFCCTICYRQTGVTQFNNMRRAAVMHWVWQGTGEHILYVTLAHSMFGFSRLVCFFQECDVSFHHSVSFAVLWFGYFFIRHCVVTLS